LEDLAQKQSTRENPRRDGRTYSGSKSQVKANEAEKARKSKDLAAFCTLPGLPAAL
jgi:hypothetical protein